uniref:Uncharacterized protein n=1 Tax=Globisporangium ultimum (strain ATCC 200006 / CBS 805.95 / DAOM BR144) TaxID=431595 RepID=K3WMK9_GLOUD
MKRHATVPITAFFQRKQPRQQPPQETLRLQSAATHNGATATPALATDGDDEAMEEISSTGSTSPPLDIDDDLADNSDRHTHIMRHQRRGGHHTTRLLHARELGSAVGILQLHPQMPRKSQQQQLVRWALTHFQPLPLELQLPKHWQRQAGFLCDDVFYTSCIEFDAQGVLLVAGSSNGIIALYDFDEQFYKSINLEQRTREAAMRANDADTASTTPAAPLPREIMHPIHTIFTRQEIKRIRWNPSNEDEIACSFSNRNEIHLFNLQKFPTKPHRVLKATSPPSSGYNDIVFLPPQATNTVLGSNVTPHSSIIGGDMNGTIRMWDPKIPSRPMWSVSTGTHPVNALLLSRTNQYLVCGTESGFLITFDVLNLSIPAFGSKAVPLRKASYHILELIKPYLTSEYASSLLLSKQTGGAGVMSIRASPSSPTQVICQLRNDWVVVVDFLHGFITKLHTFIKEPPAMPKAKSSLPASVVLMSEQEQPTTASVSRQGRNSWLSCHRCAGTLLFDDSILCTGVFDNVNLNMIDLHQLPHRPKSLKESEVHTLVLDNSEQAPTPYPLNNFNKPTLTGRITLAATKRGPGDSVGRLDRFRIPTDGLITAVSGHPHRNLVVCGGEGMRLQIVDTLDE